jgi:hypothetical protein
MLGSHGSLYGSCISKLPRWCHVLSAQHAGKHQQFGLLHTSLLDKLGKALKPVMLSMHQYHSRRCFQPMHMNGCVHTHACLGTSFGGVGQVVLQGRVAHARLFIG